jgi:serine-type D-Ala-D-Ala carboxypeptidase/endopeptidase (penicillin-binding protein 4)
MKPRYAILLLLFLAGAVVCPPRTAGEAAARAATAGPVGRLRGDLDRIFKRPRFSQAQWGVKIVSLDRAETIYQRNAERLCVPASNNKLVTVSAALASLGPDFRFQTRVLRDGPIVDSTLRGNLVIIGSGDPTGAARFHADDPFGMFKEWAGRLKSTGILSIEGAIIGDEAAFEQKILGNGWEADDLTHGYAAPVSVFQFNENQISVEISPGEQQGSPARLRSLPLENYLPLENRTTTLTSGAEADIQVERGNGRETLVVRGSVPRIGRAIVRTVSVQQPTLYYLQALWKVLEDEGVDVSKCEIRAARGIAGESLTLLWSHSSPPLREIIVPLLKESQNLYAETLVRTMGLSQRGEGGFSAGKEAVEEALTRMGIKRGTYVYADGSGLSRLNLASPDLMIGILGFMAKHASFPVFYEALPVAGVDGTLAARMQRTLAAGNVRAKTGALASVRAISGYATTADGEMLAFSMIANNYVLPGQAVEAAQDAALKLIVGFRRTGKHTGESPDVIPAKTARKFSGRPATQSAPQ